MSVLFCKYLRNESSDLHYVYHVLKGFVKFCNFWGGLNDRQTDKPTDRWTDRQTDLDIKATSWSLTMLLNGFLFSPLLSVGYL